MADARVDWPDPRSSAEIVASLRLRRYQGPAGCGVVTAVQLTEENVGAVWEWADSKPRFESRQGVSTCVGLTIRPAADRLPAYFGDYVAKSRGGSFFRFPADRFEAQFKLIKEGEDE